MCQVELLLAGFWLAPGPTSSEMLSHQFMGSCDVWCMLAGYVELWTRCASVLCVTWSRSESMTSSSLACKVKALLKARPS